MKKTLIIGLSATALMLAGCSSSTPSADTPLEVRGWSRFGGIAVPKTSAGPHASDSWVPTGFDHSSDGAAIAAITHSVTLGTATDSQWPEILRVSTVPGPGRDSYAINRVLVSVVEQIPRDEAPTVLGFVVEDYSDDAAQIAVITEQADGSITSTLVDESWAGDDWKMALPDPEDSTPRVQALDATPGQMTALEQP